MSVTGCAKWKQKHYYRSAYVEGDACGCGVSPVAYDSVVPGPASAIISAPRKVLPAPVFDDQSRLVAVAAPTHYRIPDSRFQIPNGLQRPDGIWNPESRFNRNRNFGSKPLLWRIQDAQNSEAATASPLSSSSSTFASFVQSRVSERCMPVGQPEGNTPGSQSPAPSSEDRRRGA